MTFKEYKTEVEYVYNHNPQWRMGQAAFNVLMLNRPDLSEQVRGSDIDPFHENRLLTEFYQWVEAAW